MKHKGVATIAVLAIVVGISIVVGVVSQKFLGPDNPVEQASEEVIEHAFDLEEDSIDLSPEDA